MNAVLILPLLGVVLAAPAPAVDEKSPIVKRAMETIMFGNQQNSNKVKKSDPSVPLREGIPDVNGPVLPDSGGSVEAAKAKDIVDVKSEEAKVTPEDELETVGKDKISKENEGKPESSSSEISEIAGEESKIPPADAAAIEELEKSVEGVETKEQNAAKQSPNSNGLSEEPEYESPYDIYELYKQYQDMLSQDPSYLYGYKRRRRAVQKRRFMGKLKEKAIKRAHRTKRDLTYPDESELYEPYFYPELPYSENEFYGGYENPYETEALTQNQFEPLDELLENGEYEMPYSVGQYDQPSMYEYRPLGYEDEDAFMPVKRQSMLSFVPGNKRSPYFYPVSEEPETHFGAFIPEKRDYFDTYGSLVRAARLLAAREEEREALQEYPEWY